MKKILIFILFLISCETEENLYKSVGLKKTQKIKVQGNWQSNHTLSYLWTEIDGPENHNSSRIINGNTMLFNPGVPGKYIITVSIQNSMGKILGEEKFYYNVLNDKYTDNISDTFLSEPNIINNKVVEPIVDNEINKKTTNNQNSYTIQIASWDNLEEALKNRDYLQQNGFNAYIKEFIVSGRDWYRVRVGENLSYNDCIKLVAELKKITNNQIWIDKF